MECIAIEKASEKLRAFPLKLGRVFQCCRCLWTSDFIVTACLFMCSSNIMLFTVCLFSAMRFCCCCYCWWWCCCSLVRCYIFHMPFYNKFKRQTDRTLSCLSSVWLEGHTQSVNQSYASRRIINSFFLDFCTNFCFRQFLSKKIISKM